NTSGKSNNRDSNIQIIFVSLPSVAFTQDPFSSSSGSDMLNCGPQLLPLVPCASFVQGSIPSPSQTCCNNLYDLFNQQPNCLYSPLFLLTVL
ncbi:hypothetical protein GIB67_001431, partial [Kingdonia uniflora]